MSILITGYIITLIFQISDMKMHIKIFHFPLQTHNKIRSPATKIASGAPPIATSQITL